MGGVRALLLGLAAGGWIGACSGSLGTPKSDAGGDGAASADRPSAEHPLDAGGGADRQDASSDRDGGAVCSPLDVSMWPVSQCPATWTDVVAYPQCAEQAYSQKVRVDCGGYHLVTEFGVDSNVTCSYDIARGKLAEVSFNSIGGRQCWGPPDGITADCSNAIITTVCPTDGGVSGDGGGGSCLSTGSPPFFSWNDPCPGDGGTPCYADCSVIGSQYVGCVSESAVGTRCYASCSECP